MFSKAMLLVISAFVIGIVVAGFVFSQTANSPFALTPSTSGISHTASEIVCDNCIDSSNIKDDGIINQDISNGAGIYHRKISQFIGARVFGSFIGGNAVSSTISYGSSGFGGGAVFSSVFIMGEGTSWSSHTINTICEQSASAVMDATLSVKSGVTLVQSTAYDTTFNNYVNVLLLTNQNVGIVNGLPGSGWSKVYEWKKITTSSGAVVSSRELYVRTQPSVPTQLEFGQIAVNPTTLWTTWTCQFQYE